MSASAAARINNIHACIVCARRADGMAVGRPGRLGWYCASCGPDLAKVALAMADKPKFDIYEERAAAAVAGLCGLSEFVLTAAELPDFVRWAVAEFGEAIRRELESGEPPF